MGSDSVLYSRPGRRSLSPPAGHLLVIFVLIRAVTFFIFDPQKSIDKLRSIQSLHPALECPEPIPGLHPPVSPRSIPRLRHSVGFPSEIQNYSLCVRKFQSDCRARSKPWTTAKL